MTTQTAITQTPMTGVARSSDQDVLVEQNLPLVRYVAAKLRSFSSACMDFEDLVSCGTIGLIEAVDRYDEAQGVQFRTFASLRIRGAMIDAMRELDPLSRSTRQRAKRIEVACETLTTRLGREPSHSELCAESGDSMRDYMETAVLTHRTEVSLDAPTSFEDFGEGVALADRFVDPDQGDASDRLEMEEQVRAMTAAVAKLAERDQLVLSLYYVEGLNLAEIGISMDLSATRVAQLKSRALARVRALMEAPVLPPLRPISPRTATRNQHRLPTLLLSPACDWEDRLSA